MLARHAAAAQGCGVAAPEGHVIWPSAREGAVSLMPAQLSMLLEGID
jgi:hypothetical protein